MHPVALLGWIALLEGYPPETATIDRMAARTGYPPSAFRTLREHAELDIAHGDELFAVIDRLPLTEEQATIIGLNAMSSVQLPRPGARRGHGRLTPSSVSAWAATNARALPGGAGS